MHQQHTGFENIVGKGEIARNEQFLLFPQCFQLNQITVFPFVHIFDIISLFPIRMEEPKIYISGKGLNGYESCFNPFPDKPWFLRVCSTSLLKTLWEKEKLLITSNFCFSCSVF